MSARPSLKALSADMRPSPAEPAPVAPRPAVNYRTAATRADTRQLSGHFPAEDVKAFRMMALEQDLDVQEMLAAAVNMAFERYGKPNRIDITSGRRKRA